MLTKAKIWYGDGEVRLESDGVCALEIIFEGNPKIRTSFKYKKGLRKFLLWNDYDEVFTDETLFKYQGKMKILRVLTMDWDLTQVSAQINIENVHLWELMRSDWDYLGKWENFNRSY